MFDEFGFMVLVRLCGSVSFPSQIGRFSKFRRQVDPALGKSNRKCFPGYM